MPQFDDAGILPAPPDDAQALHDREYRVRSFLLDWVGPQGERRVVVQGALRDQKPAGLLVAGDDQPLTAHHMAVELQVEFPSQTIVAADVVFRSHPHVECVAIADHYRQLVGLSVARGFTHRVRELFGGPRGCTHTTALLVAMAPVVVQSRWSMRAAIDGPTRPLGPDEEPERTPAELRDLAATQLDTCHVWADEGPALRLIRAGETFSEPMTLTRRRREVHDRDRG